MAIQLPNPGLGDGKTGDNEYVMWTKVKDNFSNQTHAASRLVGTSKNQVPTTELLHNAIDRYAVITGKSNARDEPSFSEGYNLDDMPPESFLYFGSDVAGIDNPPLDTKGDIQTYSTVITKATATTSYPTQYSYTNTLMRGYEYLWRKKHLQGWSEWHTNYSTANCDPDGTNGYLKPSSPILKIEAERMWANGDGERMGATYTKKGVGDYEISGTTGLRTDGWYIEIPYDLHGNPHVAVSIEDTDGIIRLKCFKRVFNMNTFKFEPDLESPMDIPEGRWVDLRFNDLAEEQIDEPIE